jgi:hypothetical protein
MTEGQSWFGGFGPRNQTITDVMGNDGAKEKLQKKTE